MSTSVRALAASHVPDWLRPRRSTLVWGAILVNTELLVLFVYLLVVGPTVTDPRFYAYPFIWINVALWGVARVTPPPASDAARLRAGVLAVAYFAVLAVFGGLVGPAGDVATGFRVAVTSLPPGWAPALLYSGTVVKLSLLPFKVVGYAALAYLVYATVLDAAGTAAGGVLGLLSCVSCVLPILASVVSSVLGGAGALVAAATAQTYGLSTAVFVLTVGLLVWRPVSLFSWVRGTGNND